MKHDPLRPEPAPARGKPLFPADDAFEFETAANDLAPEEQLARFLLWLKVHDAGHQPC